MLARTLPGLPALPPGVAGPGFLQDGVEVWVRPVQSADRDLLAEFVRGVPADVLEAHRLSALGPPVAGEGAVARSPPEERLGLVALGERAGEVRVVGVGEYVRSAERSPLAEVRFLVTEPYRGRGVASLLLARLARAAAAFGIERFLARMRGGEPEMLEVFRATGLPFAEERIEEEVDVVVPVEPWEHRTASERRPARARRRSHRRIPA